MFDKTVIAPTRTEHVPYEKTVTHNYATTSEQAQHLEALQKQAWDSITSHMVHQIEDNFIGAIEVHRNFYMQDMQTKVFAVFTLNGEKFEICVGAERGMEKAAFIKAIAEKLSREITERILQLACKEGEF